MRLLSTTFLDTFYPAVLITLLLTLIGLLVYLVWDMKRLKRQELEADRLRAEWLQRIATTDDDDYSSQL